MTERICLIVSIVIFVITIISALQLNRERKMRRKFFTPMNVLFAGIFLASTALFIPLYFDWMIDIEQMNGADLFVRVFDSILLAFYGAMRFFIADGDYDLFYENIHGDLVPVYTTFGLILMVIAPLLTFGFIITFFKNLSAHLAYVRCYFKPIYVFSELNQRSFNLADDLKRNRPSSAIVFTNLAKIEQQEDHDLLREARELGAVCFRKDILDVEFSLHSKKREIWFFAIAEDETDNVKVGLRLSKQYGDRPLSHLYIFTSNAESEVLFGSAEKSLGKQDKNGSVDQMKIRRINPIRSLITRTLYDDGFELFQHARPAQDGVKQIGAVVIGLGEYGQHMVKTLSWFCQMDGYRVKIDAFDGDRRAEDRFVGSCPELLDEQHNGVHISGEAEYTINIHSDFHVGTKSFADRISELTDTTYVFIALGSDEENLKAALQMRMLFERMHIQPVIQTIIYDSEKKQALTGRKNHKNQSYDIEYIGDIKSSYTEKVIIDSEIEADALARHLRGGYYTEEQFWSYEYFYRSSVAAALHAKLRILCQVPGADKAEGELSVAERGVLESLEHRRWNAYMRSEGYVFSGSTDKNSRNDLAKVHNDLVPYGLLSQKEKRKDSMIGTKAEVG